MHDQNTKQSSAIHGMQLLIVQSVVCILVLMTVGIFRWLSDDVYKDMASRFRDAMLDDTLISALVSSSDIVYASASQASTQSENTVCAPLKGGVLTSPFGYRDLLNSFHEGVDIAAEKGTPLSALKSGTVSMVEYDEFGYGHYVVVTCSKDEKYLYAHCDSVLVKAGDTVNVGQTIATVGNTGRSSGDHLHFEWIVNEQVTDPLLILPSETYV